MHSFKKFVFTASLLGAVALAGSSAFGQVVPINPSEPAPSATIQATIDAMNAKVARVESVKKFTILEKPLSIDSGELTPTMKVKRKVVNEKFAKLVDEMYATGEAE